MSESTVNYLAGDKVEPGYSLLKVTQQELEFALDCQYGSSLAKEYAREIIHLQEQLKLANSQLAMTNDQIGQLEEVIKATNLVEMFEI